jgi:SAM-dependent methyltransferase
VRCRSCGAAFYSPIPTGAELANCYHTPYYGGFLKRYWRDYYKGYRLGVELKKIKPHGRYLDVGCALGSMLAGVRDSSGWQVEGTEFSGETARAGQEINGVEITAAPALSQAGFEPGSFDYIFANNVLEHLPDPLRFLKDAKQFLKSGGYLRLSTPNGVNDIAPNEILWRRKRVILGARHEGHIWFFSERSLRIIFEKAGFAPVKFRGFHFADALKSRGLWPGALRRFEKRRIPPPGEAASGSAPAAQKRAIPPKRNRILDDCIARWREIFKFSGFRSGGDFDILLKTGTNIGFGGEKQGDIINA